MASRSNDEDNQEFVKVQVGPDGEEVLFETTQTPESEDEDEDSGDEVRLEEREDTVVIESESLAAVEGPNNTQKVIVFRPTKDSLDRVHEWAESGEEKKIVSHDNAGRYSSYEHQRVINKKYSNHGYGTLIITVQ